MLKPSPKHSEEQYASRLDQKVESLARCNSERCENKSELHLNDIALFVCLFTVQMCVKVGSNEFRDGFNVGGKLFRTTENICFLLHCVPQKTRYFLLFFKAYFLSMHAIYAGLVPWKQAKKLLCMLATASSACCCQSHLMHAADKKT